MQTRLKEAIRDTPLGREADTILRSCVHCGFCNATCPTYLVEGDELDGPRGRIWLIRDLLEGGDTASRGADPVVEHNNEYNRGAVYPIASC